MKRKVILNLPDDFILTSELLNISLKRTFETIIKNVKVYDFISRDEHAQRSGGKEIFKRFLRTKGVDGERIILEMSPAKGYIYYIQSLVKIESGVKALEYKATMKTWFQEICQDNVLSTSGSPITSGNAFCIKTTADFEVLCKLFQVDAAAFLQYYIDRISLPNKFSKHPEDPKGILKAASA